MKTTVKHVGSVREREWEGPIENWEAHVREIKHWCDGGEVETKGPDGTEYATIVGPWPRFYSDDQYRIKQREPKPGEVWLICGNYPVMITDAGYVYFDSHSGTEDIGNIRKAKIPTGGDKYAAPSIQAYYARKILEKCDPAPYSDQRGYIAYNALQDAAQLDH